jgi:hypothetical protein
MSRYEPNIGGAIDILIDIMTANGFTLTRQPYDHNYGGLIEALIDLKDGFPTFAPERVGFDATTFEAVADGDALYMRASDGAVGKARAAGSLDEAIVVGFADDAAALGATVKVLVAGLLDYPSAVNPGDVHFLSTTAGEITTTAPSTAGQYVTRVGEGATTSEFSIQLEPPILLS